MQKPVSLLIVSLISSFLLFDATDSTQVLLSDPAQQAASQSQAAWETYTYPGEEFSVMLPEMPALDDDGRNVKGSLDKYEEGRNYGAYGNGVVYLIRAYDKPHEGEDLNFFAYEYMKQFAYSGQTVEFKIQRELQSNKFPGRQYFIKRGGTPDEIVISSLYVYLTARHAYVLRAVGVDESHPEVRRFLASFTLTDKPAGRQIVRETHLPFSDPKPKESKTKVGNERPKGDELPKVGRSAGDRSEEMPTQAEDAASDNQTYKQSDVTRKAIVVSKPYPPYTEKARRNQITGTVRLRIVLAASGKVINIVPLSRLADGLTEKAMLAASHIKFIPAIKEGRYVSQYVTIEYNFNIY